MDGERRQDVTERVREDPAVAGEPTEETWPRSAGPPVSDIDLKRPGKVDRALRAKVERGAGRAAPPVRAADAKRTGREELDTSGYDEQGIPRRG